MAGLIGSPGGGGFFGALEEIARNNPNQWSSLAGNFLAGGSMRESLAGIGKAMPVASTLDRQRRSAASLLSSPLFQTLSPEMQRYYTENPEAFAAFLEEQSKPKDLIKGSEGDWIYDPNRGEYIRGPGGTGVSGAGGPYKNTSVEGVDNNLIISANRAGGDISTPEYAYAFHNVFEQPLYRVTRTDPETNEVYTEDVYKTLPAWIKQPTWSGSVGEAPPADRLTEDELTATDVVEGGPTSTGAVTTAPAVGAPVGAGTPTATVPTPGESTTPTRVSATPGEEGAPAATAAPVAGLKTPPIGTVINGYRFSGGNAGGTSGAANWQEPGTWEANFPRDAKGWAAAREAGKDTWRPGELAAGPAAPSAPAVTSGVVTEPGGFRHGPRIPLGPQKKTEGQVRGQVLLQQSEPAYKIALDNFGALEDFWSQAGGGINQALGDTPLAPFTEAGTRYFMQTPEYQRAHGAIETLVTNYVFAVSGSTTRQAEVKTITEALMPQLGEAASETEDKKARLTQTINAIRIRAQAGLEPGEATDLAGATPFPVAAEE